MNTFKAIISLYCFNKLALLTSTKFLITSSLNFLKINGFVIYLIDYSLVYTFILYFCRVVIIICDDNKFNMNNSTYKQETLVIEKPSKALVDLMNKLRDRKMAQLEELRNKKDFYFSKK